MCSERDPLDCHRCLLVTRALADRKLTVGHILFDGTIEPHATTERRLLELAAEDSDLFAPGQPERLAACLLYTSYEVDRVGVFTPKRVERDELGPGEIGFLTASIKEVADTRVGDTITDERKPCLLYTSRCV